MSARWWVKKKGGNRERGRRQQSSNRGREGNIHLPPSFMSCCTLPDVFSYSSDMKHDYEATKPLIATVTRSNNNSTHLLLLLLPPYSSPLITAANESAWAHDPTSTQLHYFISLYRSSKVPQVVRREGQVGLLMKTIALDILPMTVYTVVLKSYRCWVNFHFLFCLMIHLLTWRGQSLWPVLMPATRGQMRGFAVTLRELSFCPSLHTATVDYSTLCMLPFDESFFLFAILRLLVRWRLVVEWQETFLWNVACVVYIKHRDRHNHRGHVQLSYAIC